MTDDTRVLLRPLASPLPLGFLGLAGGTIILAGQQLGWVPSVQSHLVAAAVLVVAVPLQAVACVIAFLSRDPAVATGMGVLTACWSAIGLLTLLGPPGGRSPVLGLLLFYLAAAVLVAAGISTLSKLLAAAVLTTAAARFAVTGVYEYLGGQGWMRTAGWLGLALGALALVAAALFALEDARRSPLAATGRIGPGRRSMTDALPDSEGPVDREAGVRDLL